MKKQYIYFEGRSFCPIYIKLYHDGILVAKEERWPSELSKYLDWLEKEGYTEGFDEEDVEEAKKEYEFRLAHQIKPKEKN